jgi:hypothetical protein
MLVLHLKNKILVILKKHLSVPGFLKIFSSNWEKILECTTCSLVKVRREVQVY